METVIIVLENKAIDVNGVVLQKEDFGYYKYYGMFIKRNFGFYPGAVIVQKKQGRPRSSTRVQKTLRIDKKHVDDLNKLVKGLNMSDRIVAKVNEGQEPDVKPYTIDDIPLGLIKFWTNELSK
jgi:hypothetical protein